MKIALLITVCSLNQERITNQVKNLEKNKQWLEQYNIVPYFVSANPTPVIPSEYKVIELPYNDEYFYLAKKTVLSIEHILEHTDCDYILKIDDDTIFNVDRFDLDYLQYDYVGGMDSVKKSRIIIDLPPCRIYDELKLYPSLYSSAEFTFAHGDFYGLSRRAAEHVVSHKHLLDDMYTENVRVSEDQFVGYCMYLGNFTSLNIKSDVMDHNLKALQITKNYMSLHPIHNSMFLPFLEKTPEEQITALEKSTVSLIYREFKLLELKKELHNVILEFMNSKKSMGMG